MQNKLCIIASWFLFSGACSAVSPASAMAAAGPATSVMSRMMPRMQFGAKVGAFLLTAHIVDSAAKNVTNSISDRLFKQDRAGAGSNASSYARKGLSLTTSIFTQAGINWALLPFLFPQRRHTFQFSLALTTASVITAAVTQRAADYCLSKFSSKSTKKLLLSLGLVLPAVAGLEYIRVKMPYSIMRACTGVGESPLVPAGLCVMTALFSLWIPTLTCIESENSLLLASKRLVELNLKLQQNPANDALWQEVEKEADAIKWVFTDERYSFAKLHSNALLPQPFLNSFLEAKERAVYQLAEFYRNCPEGVRKDKLARILFPSVIKDFSFAVAASDELLKREEQKLAYVRELGEECKQLADLSKSAAALLGTFTADQRQDSFRVQMGAFSGEMKKLANQMVEKMKSLGKVPAVETESIAENLVMLEQGVARISSSLTKLSIASTRDQVLELQKVLDALSKHLIKLEADNLVVPENRLKVNACIVSMLTRFMQIMESKFTLISQQLPKAALSSQELAKLSRHFSDLIMVKRHSIDLFARYIRSNVLFDKISLEQIPSLRAAFAEAALSLRFKSA